MCRLAHFEYSTKYGMATCHEVVIREKSGLEVVNADKFAVFAAESATHSASVRFTFCLNSNDLCEVFFIAPSPRFVLHFRFRPAIVPRLF